jgi:hypothetical protein
MKKNLKIYYGLLTSAVLAQVIMTVFTLSQNIGYGQKISFLENKKHTLENQINTLRTDFSKKVAIAKLEETKIRNLWLLLKSSQ